jgi:uncharacterized protein YaiI (UPF0178 family)
MTPATPRIFVDADACPVKEEVYRVAARFGLKVFVVANVPLYVPADPRIERVRVDPGFDGADDWIAGNVSPGDVVVTADIPLADRCIKGGAAAIPPTGRTFTEDSIGGAVAMRSIMEQLRASGIQSGGPKPFERADRSRFLQALDAAIRESLRRNPPG